MSEPIGTVPMKQHLSCPRQVDQPGSKPFLMALQVFTFPQTVARAAVQTSACDTNMSPLGRYPTMGRHWRS